MDFGVPVITAGFAYFTAVKNSEAKFKEIKEINKIELEKTREANRAEIKKIRENTKSLAQEINIRQKAYEDKLQTDGMMSILTSYLEGDPSKMNNLMEFDSKYKKQINKKKHPANKRKRR